MTTRQIGADAGRRALDVPPSRGAIDGGARARAADVKVASAPAHGRPQGHGVTELVIRPCGRGDLRGLEWSAALREDCLLIEWVYRRTRTCEMEMLVAMIGDHHVGQIWIDYGRKPSIGVLWALRVRADWQGHGIGTLLIACGEHCMRRRGIVEAELTVEPHNVRAGALYQSLGYRSIAREAAVHAITGHPLGHDLDVLRRRLAIGPRARPTDSSPPAR